MSVNADCGDRLSELPDELVESIVSRLAMSEAVATSFLSRRWKHIWKYSSGSFDFDFGSAALATMKQTREFTRLETERVHYMNRVQSFFRSHAGPYIDRFKIRFDLRADSAVYINDWLSCLTNRVGSLDLDFSVVNPRSLNEYSRLSKKERKQYYKLEFFYSVYLTSLKLFSVSISRETVENILCLCPVLDNVSIIKSPGLSGVIVPDACPKLKHLKIAHCQNFKFLCISSAPNLISLFYSGSKETILYFQQVPNLVDVSLQGEYCAAVIQKLHEISLPFSQIQNLKLWPLGLLPTFNRFPELKSVTELELEFEIVIEHSFLSCAYAIEACPNLSSLSVKMNWLTKPAHREVVEFPKGSCNKCLKTVKLWGFRGSQTDIELAAYIFSTSPSLERIAVYTMDIKYTLGTACTDFSENLAAKDIAKLLASRLSPAAHLHLGCAPMPYPVPPQHLL